MTRGMTNNQMTNSAVIADIEYILEEVLEIDHHFHNTERVISNGGVNLTPFVATSGNNVYGAEVEILAAGATPIQAGKAYYDFNRIFIVSVDHTSTYRMQVAYGTGTFAAAMAAGQYTELIYETDNVNQRSTVPYDFRFPHVPSGTKAWWRIWNATNGSQIDAFFVLHEYDA